MQFWGCEVNHGKALQVAHQEGMYVHVTQAALGPDPKEGERVLLEMVVAGKPFVLGTLKKGTCDQIHLDLVLDTDFALRHSGSCNVFFTGYMTRQQYMDSDEEGMEEESDEDEEDEDLELEGKSPDEESEEEEEEEEEEAPTKKKVVKSNGAVIKPGKAMAVKPAPVAKKPAAQAAAEEPDKFKRMVLAKAKSFDMEPPDGGAGGLEDPGVDDEDDEMEEDDFGDEDDSDEDDEDEEDEDEEDESEDEEELTPVFKQGKRPAETPVKTPVPAKKTKPEAAPTPTPKKPAAKEGKPSPAANPTSTPAKSASKAEPQSAGKGNATPGKKLGGHKCADCDRAFATETALSQHSQSKHKK